jgi:hypothetical protein
MWTTRRIGRLATPVLFFMRGVNGAQIEGIHQIRLESETDAFPAARRAAKVVIGMPDSDRRSENSYPGTTT